MEKKYRSNESPDVEVTTTSSITTTPSSTSIDEPKESVNDANEEHQTAKNDDDDVVPQKETEEITEEDITDASPAAALDHGNYKKKYKTHNISLPDPYFAHLKPHKQIE